MVSQQNIAILLPNLIAGGAERVCVDLAGVFRDRGYGVQFVLRNKQGELLEEAAQIGDIIDLKAPRVRHAMKPLVTYFRDHRPDGMVAAMWPLTAFAARARLMSGHSCSLVLSEHGMLSQQYEGWGAVHRLLLRHTLRYASRRADHVVGVSKGVAQDIAELSGRDPAHFKTIYNPVPLAQDPSKDALDAAEAFWSVPKGRRIITVSRLKEVKDHRSLLEAFALLPHQDAELMIVGDGELREELEQYAADLGVAERVIFAGFQPDPTPFYRTADLFVLSSRREGFGNVLVEAMNQGLRIVSTDCPTGPREVLEGGKYGLLTKVGDADALADAIVTALDRPAEPETQRARAAAFRPEIAADAYLKLLFGAPS